MSWTGDRAGGDPSAALPRRRIRARSTSATELRGGALTRRASSRAAAGARGGDALAARPARPAPAPAAADAAAAPRARRAGCAAPTARTTPRLRAQRRNSARLRRWLRSAARARRDARRGFRRRRARSPRDVGRGACVAARAPPSCSRHAGSSRPGRAAPARWRARHARRSWRTRPSCCSPAAPPASTTPALLRAAAVRDAVRRRRRAAPADVVSFSASVWARGAVGGADAPARDHDRRVDSRPRLRRVRERMARLARRRRARRLPADGPPASSRRPSTAGRRSELGADAFSGATRARRGGRDGKAVSEPPPRLCAGRL